MKKIYLLLLILFTSNGVFAEGIDCDILPEWSNKIDGYQLNLHHVFCGEAGKKSRAKGFHAMPGGNAPSNFISYSPGDPTNKAGIYTLKNIKLTFAGKTYKKSFSSMFPKSCNQVQITNSIVYSRINSRGPCSSPGWASCGPNAPESGGTKYCVAENGSFFTIASAVLPGGTKRINTGFPIYTP